MVSDLFWLISRRTGKRNPSCTIQDAFHQQIRKYAQIDKEGLSVIVGWAKFRKNLWGRPFRIVTDHRPLLGLFVEERAVSQTLSPRMQRWALSLAAYVYQIIHRPGLSIPQADVLSRLPQMAIDEYITPWHQLELAGRGGHVRHYQPP